MKAVVGAYGWLDDLMVRIHKRGVWPDFFTLDSGDGGTGAAPMALMDNVGLSIRESLPLVRDIIKKHNLAERIPIIASGKLTTPAEVAWALCAGATFVNSARGFMFALGCIQSLKCNKNTCPTGITTHDKRLQKGLDPADKAVRVASYCRNMRHDVEVIAHSCGVPQPRAFPALPCAHRRAGRRVPAFERTLSDGRSRGFEPDRSAQSGKILGKEDRRSRKRVGQCSRAGCRGIAGYPVDDGLKSLPDAKGRANDPRVSHRFPDFAIETCVKCAADQSVAAAENRAAVAAC